LGLGVESGRNGQCHDCETAACKFDVPPHAENSVLCRIIRRVTSAPAARSGLRAKLRNCRNLYIRQLPFPKGDRGATVERKPRNTGVLAFDALSREKVQGVQTEMPWSHKSSPLAAASRGFGADICAFRFIGVHPCEYALSLQFIVQAPTLSLCDTHLILIAQYTSLP
jgi:hypothetical protein